EKSFFLSFDGREVYACPPAALLERITACFGREAASGLEEFENAGITGRVWGFVLTTAEVWRRRYYFFVNRRAVRNRTVYREVRDALPGEGGMVFLFFRFGILILLSKIHVLEVRRTELRQPLRGCRGIMDYAGTGVGV